METKKYLEFLVNKIHTVIIATNNEYYQPITCAIDIMLFDDQGLYFLTAKGKNFYQRLMNTKYISLTGLYGNQTMNSISISLQGRVRNIRTMKLQEIFDKNPYMNDIYPNQEARTVLEVFQIYEGTGEYFDLTKLPIKRSTFNLGKIAHPQDGYDVGINCIGCGLCNQGCPQKCIIMDTIPVQIVQEYCLHCGKCAEICPQHAIYKRG